MRPPIFVIDTIVDRSQHRLEAYSSVDEVQNHHEILDVEDGAILFYDADGKALVADVDSKTYTWRLIGPADAGKDPDALRGFLIEYLVACGEPYLSLQDLDLRGLVELAAPLHLIEIRLESHYQARSAAIGGTFQAKASWTGLSAKVHFVDRNVRGSPGEVSRVAGFGDGIGGGGLA